MTSKHTSGPWRVDSSVSSGHIEVVVDTTLDGEDYTLMLADLNYNVPGRSWYVPETEAQANAALIAASPDLLRCLCELLGMAEVDLMDDKSNVWRNAMLAAQSAIAKATGAD